MKMNDELKAHVNAYMDGLEVEYRFNTHWYSVESFSDFDDTNADYRIKPKAEDKWQRVIDEQPWKQLIKHVERLDDTVTRLTLEMAEVRKQLKNCECEDEPTSNDGGIPIPIHRKK